MTIFNNQKEPISNDFYEAYKEEIGAKKRGIEREKNRFFTLNNFLKLEIVAVAVGFFLLNQESLTSEFKKISMASDDSLPVSIQQNSALDKELVVTEEEDDATLDKIAISEERMVEEQRLDKEALAENEDLKLLIELLKVEMKEKEEASAANRLVISQK